MPEPRWKYAEPIPMEEAADLTYTVISWTFGQPAMMIDATVTVGVSIPVFMRYYRNRRF